MPEKGDVYWDNALKQELFILEIREGSMLVEHEEIEAVEYSDQHWSINKSCGRFEKVREVSGVDEPEQEETAEKESLFDF